MKYKNSFCFFILQLFISVFVYSQNFYTMGDLKSNKFALTYDDGPGVVTDKLLDLLKKYNVKATFFLLGENIEKYPDKVKRIYLEGHLLGNHTYSHKNFFIIDKKADRCNVLEMEISKVETLFKKLNLPLPKYLRLPNGFFKRWALQLAAEKNYIVTNWSYGIDWHKISEEKMVEGYLTALSSGTIFLMHDGGGIRKEKILRITEEILKAADKRGLKAVRLDEMFGK